MKTYFHLGLDMKLIGSQFSKTGATIALHKDDHAISSVENDGIVLNPGTYNTIRLKKFEVHIIEFFQVCNPFAGSKAQATKIDIW